MHNKRDIEFLFELGCFRYVQRTWKRFSNPDMANNAEHTMRVMWIALMLAKYEGVKDEEKIIKMAMVHDLPESRAGDVDYLSRQYVERKEAEAVEDIFNGTVLDAEAVAWWKEYEKRECMEAKIVKDADNLDVELELREQESKGHPIGTMWKEKRDQLVKVKLFTETAKQIWEDIRNSNPHDWHLNGRNRFNMGDWQKKEN